MKKIAVIGGTGMIGKPVVKAFAAQGYEVTVLARNGHNNDSLGNVKYIKGDLENKVDIKRLLNGQEYVYLNLSVKPESSESGFQPEREGLDNILSVAKECGVKKVAYLSSLVHLYKDENWWVFNLKRLAISKIKTSGLDYAIFYPSTFMESFGTGAYRMGNFLCLAGTSKYKMFLIAGEDYASQVVNSFNLTHTKQEWKVQGKEGFTADTAAHYYSNLDPKVQVIKAPLFILKLAGLFMNKFNYGYHIVNALNNYPEVLEAQKTWEILGEPQMSFEDYIKKSF